MRQYFTGFFSALCLSASFYLFTEVSHDNSDNNEENQVVLTSEDGKTIIEGGSMRFINKEGKEIVYISNVWRFIMYFINTASFFDSRFSYKQLSVFRPAFLFIWFGKSV